VGLVRIIRLARQRSRQRGFRDSFGTGARGAYGVAGMKLGDLLQNVAGDELVVATVSGDLIVYNVDPGTAALTELCRTHVLGSIGFYNSMAIEDLNNDGHNELYVAGSLGLWRFNQPGEQLP
jgi:hypothetical protein